MYSYEDMLAGLDALAAKGAKKFVVGYSLFGREIAGVFKGAPDGPQLLIQGAMHAREWATAELCVRLFDAYDGDAGLWCLPMTDPDGAMLAQFGVDSAPSGERDYLLSLNGGSEDFSLWKANGRGVDLNVNFPALWGTGTSNRFAPAPSDYVGEHPLSEPESRSLALFTLKVQPSATVSVHARGGVIYGGFGCYDPERALAEEVAAACGYPLLKAEGSAGGYKDWFIATTARLGLTVEVGEEDTPYPELQDELGEIFARTRDMLPALSAHYVGQSG